MFVRRGDQRDLPLPLRFVTWKRVGHMKCTKRFRVRHDVTGLFGIGRRDDPGSFLATDVVETGSRGATKVLLQNWRECNIVAHFSAFKPDRGDDDDGGGDEERPLLVRRRLRKR